MVLGGGFVLLCVGVMVVWNVALVEVLLLVVLLLLLLLLAQVLLVQLVLLVMVILVFGRIRGKTLQRIVVMFLVQASR